MKILIFSMLLFQSAFADSFLYPAASTVWDWNDSEYATIQVEPRQTQSNYHAIYFCYPGRPDFECVTLYSSTEQQWPGARSFNFVLPPRPAVDYPQIILKWYFEGGELTRTTVNMAPAAPILRPKTKARVKVPRGWRFDVLGRVWRGNNALP